MREKTKKPRITLFHCGFIYTGGGERMVIEEVLGLRKLGYPVECYAPTFDRKACYPDIIDQVGVKTLLPSLPSFIPLRFAFAMLLTCLLAPFFVWRFRHTDVFLGANQPGIYLAWVMARILQKPYFIYLNQPNRILYPREGENWQSVADYYFLNSLLKRFRGLLRFLDTRSIMGAGKVFVNEAFIAKEITRVYGLKGLVNCPAGVADPKTLVPNFSVRRQRSQGLVRVNGHYAKKPYILLTSRHVPWKRFDWAIRVMAEVVKRVPEAGMIFPGAYNDETERLINLTAELGLEDKVYFPGVIAQKSLWRLYQNASVYCFPSPEEDLGIVVLEAQAFGVPVVAFNYGGPTRTVKNGVTGFLVEPYDLEAMAKKIIILLTDKQLNRRLSLAAYRHVRTRFSWEKHLKILETEMRLIDKKPVLQPAWG